MFNFYAQKTSTLFLLSEEEKMLKTSDPMWIDVCSPTLEEEHYLEALLVIDIPTTNNLNSTELSERHYVKNDNVFITVTMITDDKKVQNVIFILSRHHLVTLRYASINGFDRCLKYFLTDNYELSAEIIFISLFESALDEIDNHLEQISQSIENLTYSIFNSKNHPAKKSTIRFRDIISEIGINGDFIAKSYESLVSIARGLTFITELKRLKGKKANNLLNDSAYLKERASFLSSKINFLLDVSLGMINIEQNKIIKSVSIAGLVFLPPTIVTGIYGMNFVIIPELKWPFGYPYALLLIFLSAVLPYYYFKRKNLI